MPPLDLLGTVAGAAFLAGSVLLAIRVDRREPARGEWPGEPGAVTSSTVVAPAVRRLRLVVADDQESDDTVQDAAGPGRVRAACNEVPSP